MTYTGAMTDTGTEQENTQPSAEISLDINAEVDRVWNALVTEGGLGPWMGDGATLDPRPGGALSFPDPAGGQHRDGRVAEVIDGERLQYVWWATDRPTERSSVTITLRPFENGTRVTVTETLESRHPIGFRMSSSPTTPRPALSRSTSLIGTWSWRLAMVTVAATMARV